MPSDQNDSTTRLDAIFDQALDLTGADRAEFLDRACAGNPALRQKAEQLLRITESGQEHPLFKESALLVEARHAAAAPVTLDRYKILERIGAGGMGVVYKAVRADDTFEKIVAIKLMQIAAGESGLTARFHEERRILASLSHPNIAQVFDAGNTAEGQPFLVMEYVDGEPIGKYVARCKPSHRELAALFIKVCSAVGCAHRNLIVHRDLKPGNILVTAEGEPKLLDFGVAKLLDGSMETTQGGMTPRYASPEQVQGAAITTSSDIYSLGVLFYELLGGKPLYGDKTSPMELARAIQEDAPPPLENADRDLENIARMALRKEPERRYATAEQMAEDLSRYQTGYPVKARPDTRGYRTRKFLGRNKLPIAAAALVLIALAGGVAATIRQARIANRHFNEVRNLANYFVSDVHDAIKDLPGALPVRKIIVGKALEYLDNLSRDQGNDRELQGELATAYEQIASVQSGLQTPSNLGDDVGALASLGKAAAIRELLVAAYPRDRQELKGLAECYSSLGATQAQKLGDLKNGVATLRKAAAIGEMAVAAGPHEADIETTLADVYLMLGDALGNSSFQNLGDTKGAADLYRKALTIRERLTTAEPESKARQFQLAMAENRLGMVLQATGDLNGSLPHLRRVLEIDEKALAAEPHSSTLLINTASANRNLALVLGRAGKRKDGLPLAQRAGVLYKQAVDDNPKDLGARVSLAGSYYAMGWLLEDDVKAIPLFDASIAGYRAVRAERPQSAPEVGWRTALKYRAEAAIRLGNAALVIDSAGQLKEIVDGLLKASPDNFTARADRCRISQFMGEAYEIRSRKSGGVAERLQAAAYFQQAVNEYSALEKKAPLSSTDKGAFTRSTQALASLHGH